MIGQNGILLSQRYWKWAYPTGALYSPAEIDDMVYIDGYIPIATANELNILRNTTTQTMGDGTKWKGLYTTGVDKKYVQIFNIDITGLSFSAFPSFSGTFDGNELIINTDVANMFSSPVASGLFKNIRINGTFDTGTTYCGGIFYVLYGSAINCKFTGSITSVYRAGGICLILSNGNLTNCEVDCTINSGSYSGMITGRASGSITQCKAYGELNGGIGDYIGGIVGILQDDLSITKCANYATISGRTEVAGILGSNHNYDDEQLIMSECFNVGNITGSGRDTGGVLGYGKDNDLISDCFNTGTVSGGTYRVGGFSAVNTGSIENCYSTGLVTGTAPTKGGFSGYNSGTITNSYWNTGTSGLSTSAGGTGLTDAEFQVQANFVGFDFVNKWYMGTYPLLRAFQNE